MRKRLFFVVILISVLVACTTAAPTSDAKFQLRYACINLDLEPCVAAEEFAKRVQDRTNGEVVIQITAFPEIGLSGADSLRLLENGSLGMAEIYSGLINRRNRQKLAILNIDNLWGLYQDYDAQKLVAEATREDIDKIIETKSGGAILAYQFYPGNYIFSKKPLRTATDIKGLNIRANSAISADLLEGMGANSLDVVFGKVSAGLESGQLDAAISCGLCGFRLGWYKTARYLVGPVTAGHHTWITMNTHRWAELPSNIQVIILEEAKRHQELTRENALSIWTGTVENQKKGMEYIEFTPELKKLARKAALTNVVPRWIHRTGGPYSEARRVFNLRVAPIVKTKINAEGQAEEMR